VKLVPDEVSLKYRDQSIFQHPKIQAPSSHNSVYMDDNLDKSQHSYTNKSPEKIEFSLASRKYLEKHRLVSPPTKHVNRKTVKTSLNNGKIVSDKTSLNNGKIVSEKVTVTDPECLELQTLELK
jgi:hypothetical protein